MKLERAALAKVSAGAGATHDDSELKVELRELKARYAALTTAHSSLSSQADELSAALLAKQQALTAAQEEAARAVDDADAKTASLRKQVATPRLAVLCR